MSETPLKKETYTEVSPSSINPVHGSIPAIGSIDNICKDIEYILSTIDSKHITAFRRGQFIEINNIYTNQLKQYLYGLNLFIKELVTTSTKSTSKKGLLYRQIFNIINSSYELLDTISHTKDGNEEDITEILNSALLGFTLKHTKKTYDEYTNRSTGQNK
mgnify:CR=1 FL=1